MAGPGGGRKNVGGTVESWSGAFAFGAGAWLGLAAVVACNDVLGSGAAGRAVVFFSCWSGFIGGIIRRAPMSALSWDGLETRGGISAKTIVGGWAGYTSGRGGAVARSGRSEVRRWAFNARACANRKGDLGTRGKNWVRDRGF